MTTAAISPPHSGFLALSQTFVPTDLPKPIWGNYDPGPVEEKL